jgi:hypothetical protein
MNKYLIKKGKKQADLILKIYDDRCKKIINK